MTDETTTQDSFPRESWVVVMRRVGYDAYLIYRGGEVSLVDKTTLISLMRQLLKEQQL